MPEPCIAPDLERSTPPQAHKGRCQRYREATPCSPILRATRAPLEAHEFSYGLSAANRLHRPPGRPVATTDGWRRRWDPRGDGRCRSDKSGFAPLPRAVTARPRHGCRLRRGHLAHDCYGLGRVNGCRGPNIGRRGTTDDQGRRGSRAAAGREPAQNATRGGGRGDHFFRAPDRGARAAQALCSRQSAGAGELADQFGTANRGGRRTVARPVRRHRLPVVHRGATGPDRPPRGPLFRRRCSLAVACCSSPCSS